MNEQANIQVKRTCYDRKSCRTGIVHLGFGAFHRAHQAVYIDDYMEATGDLNWGIAAVNLRSDDRHVFSHFEAATKPFLLKSTLPDGITNYREIRSHTDLFDWSKEKQSAEKLVSLPSVKVISMTVTESGYFFDENWQLNTENPVIRSEIEGGEKQSVYAYLASALKKRMEAINEPITILCCDNIRDNGERLAENFATYLSLTGQKDVRDWLQENATFPNAMVDRITPRSTPGLAKEVSILGTEYRTTATHSESFIQWVLQENFAQDFPDLGIVGVELVKDVKPYEEAKIRILNGGHTGLCYLGALAGHLTFDQAMADPVLRNHFDSLQKDNVLPGLNIELPFDKHAYLDNISERFCNVAIADDLTRICMDGWSKFPIFIRPTLESCLAQGIDPQRCYESIASWYVFAKRHGQGQTHITYIEPFWHLLEPLLSYGNEEKFAREETLWGDLPLAYQEFVPGIISAIKRVEEKWPI